MKTIKITLPDKLGAEVENYVKSGWFSDEAELLCSALHEFIRHNRLKLMEQFMKEDIEWALKAKKSAGQVFQNIALDFKRHHVSGSKGITDDV